MEYTTAYKVWNSLKQGFIIVSDEYGVFKE
jgi:hypothetical protein